MYFLFFSKTKLIFNIYLLFYMYFHIISPLSNIYLTFIYRYQGQKVRKPMQACLQEDFWPLDPPKTWVSSHFSKKNERITNVFEDCESAKHVAIWYQRGQNTFWPQHHMILYDSLHCTPAHTKINKLSIKKL